MATNSLAETRQPTIYTVLIVFVALATLAVVIRFVSRCISGVRSLYHDTLIVAGKDNVVVVKLTHELLTAKLFHIQ